MKMNKTKATMAAFSRKTAPVMEVEAWETRFGKSVRVVKRRKDGQFVTNVSAKQLAKIV